VTDLGWKTESQHVTELAADEQALYHRLSAVYALWTMVSFALPVAVAGTYAWLTRTGVVARFPPPFRVYVSWKQAVIVALVALPIHIVGALLLRRRMKRIITDALARREWV
jgi:hypothetical protein